MSDSTRKVVKLCNIPENLLRRKRVAAYARVSSGKEAMLQSLSAQISYYNKLIQQRGDWVFAGIYADEAMTGTKDARPEFQRLLADCRAGKIDMVLNKSVTRFARNTVTTLEAVRELKALGVDVYFEQENLHTLSADGEFILTILASYAQEESRSASENQLWRIRKMFEEGRPNTGRMLGYRLRDGKLVVMPEEAEIVRRIFSDYLSGMGVVAIAKKLNHDGVESFYSAVWRHTTIHRILCNEKYTGDLLLQKTYRLDHLSKKQMPNRGEKRMYHVADCHDPIISKEMFEQVASEMARRAGAYNRGSAPERAAYPFTGLIRCDTCGCNYIRKHTANGSKYDKIAWHCNTFTLLGKNACPSKRIPEDILIAKTVQVLGLAEFDEAALKRQISRIHIVSHSLLRFVFHNGHTIDAEWQNHSRKDSWTPEMKQAARERQLNRRRGTTNNE